MIDETWETIKDFPNYNISSLGRVEGPRGEIKINIRPVSTSNRYLIARVSLYAWPIQKIAVVAHLVAAAFIGERPKGLYVCHKNGNSLDNRAENLYYGTQKENVTDAIKHGTFHRGANTGGAKLNEDKVRAIRTDSRANIEIAEEYGISLPQVYRIKHKQTWKWLE